MGNKQKIKRLAIIAAKSSTIPRDIEEYVLTCFKKQELKEFLHYYKDALSKNRVFVTSSLDLSEENKTLLKSIFKEKELITLKEEDLGAGIKIRQNDTIIDYTFKKYINDTIEKLKN